MTKYAITRVDNGSVEYLVMFGYDGGKWIYKFASGDLFAPVCVWTAHAAYDLLNFLSSNFAELRSYLFVEEVDLGA